MRPARGVHRAVLLEKGVEAAAAVVTYDSGGGVSPERTFTADRPFLFAIRDRGTGSPFGRALAPS